jgi:signal transduction histidine kinase
MAARGGAGGGTTARLVRPRSSLLGRVIAVLGLSFFAVEVTILGVFTAGAWRWLVERREEDLREHGDRLHGVARAALDARGRPDDTAEVDSALAAALALPGAHGRAAPPVAAPEPPGGVAIEAWVLTRGGEALRVSGGVLEPAHAEASPAARWPADLAAEVTSLLRDGGVASVVSARLPRGAFLSERLVRVLPLPGGRGAPDAVLVLESPLRDAQRQLVAWGFGAFGVGAVALLITAMVTMSYLRRALLAPLGRMIRADNAARRGDRLGAIVDEAQIPDDEVGAIMRSRNALFLNMVASREALDRQNAELARQREELRAWGKELERLVEHKTTALLGARDTLHRTEKLAAVGRLAANVAHEINNPLASIAGYAEAAREQLAADEKEEVAQALGTIETQAFRCKEILKRLLGLARADAVEVQDVDLGELLTETVGLVEVAARRRAVAVSLEGGVSAGEGADGPLRPGRAAAGDPEPPRQRRRRGGRRRRDRPGPGEGGHPAAGLGPGPGRGGRPGRGPGRRHRQRARRPRGGPGPDLRPLLHDQARRPRDRPRPRDQPLARRAARRADHRRLRAGRRRGLHGAPPPRRAAAALERHLAPLARGRPGGVGRRAPPGRAAEAPAGGQRRELAPRRPARPGGLRRRRPGRVS